MQFEGVAAGLSNFEYSPLTSPAVGRLLYELALEPGAEEWLELGFDDLSWTFATRPSLRESREVAAMPEEERIEQQVRKVVDLLVRTTPGYQVRLLGNVALAFKGEPDAPEFQHLPAIASAFLREA